MAKRERADGVGPVGVGHPQAVELVPQLFQGQDAIGVVAKLADQEDFEAVAGRRGVGTFAVPPVVLDLVDAMADGRMEA